MLPPINSLNSECDGTASSGMSLKYESIDIILLASEYSGDVISISCSNGIAYFLIHLIHISMMN